MTFYALNVSLELCGRLHIVVSPVESESSNLGLNPGQAHCVVFSQQGISLPQCFSTPRCEIGLL